MLRSLEQFLLLRSKRRNNGGPNTQLPPLGRPFPFGEHSSSHPHGPSFVGVHALVHRRPCRSVWGTRSNHMSYEMWPGRPLGGFTFEFSSNIIKPVASI